jgi:hypothetical protein
MLAGCAEAAREWSEEAAYCELNRDFRGAVDSINPRPIRK